MKILAVDCGIKNNMMCHICVKGTAKSKLVPWNHDITKEPYDGLFLSNGPGDPKMANETMEFVRKIVVDAVGVNPMNPIFGICMGNQLLGQQLQVLRRIKCFEPTKCTCFELVDW